MSAPYESNDDHTTMPIALKTATVFASHEVMRVLDRTKSTLFDANRSAAITGRKRHSIYVHNLVAELNDVQGVGAFAEKSHMHLLADFGGIDGTMFGLPPSAETRDLLMERGYSEEHANRMICESFMHHIRTSGIALTGTNPKTADASCNDEFTLQYSGAINFLCVYKTRVGDLLSAFIPTPQQLARMDPNESTIKKFFGKGEVPLLLRPMKIVNMVEKAANNVDLYVNHPDLHNRLYGTVQIANVAHNNALQHYIRGQKLVMLLGMYKFFKDTNMAPAAIGLVGNGGKDKRSLGAITRVYQAIDVNGANEFELSLAAGSAPHLRRLFYRNTVENRIAKNGDPIADITSAVEPEDILVILGVALGLIDPAEVTVGTFEGIVGQEFTNNRIFNSSIKLSLAELLTMKKNDARMTPLTAALKFEVELVQMMNLYVKDSKKKVAGRSRLEVGDVEDNSEQYVTNLAKTSGTYGRITDMSTEIGRMANCQEIDAKALLLGIAQLYQVDLKDCVARNIKNNNPIQNGNAFLIGGSML